MMGIVQEQHPDRCRLFMQWKQMGWPVVVDALNRLGFDGVPITFLIDEHGIIRFVNPEPADLETLPGHCLPAPARAPDGAGRDGGPGARRHPGSRHRRTAWRDRGDALFLWGGDERLGEALEAYGRALAESGDDGPLHFRLGTTYRRRYDSPHRETADFQRAVDHWARALDDQPQPVHLAAAASAVRAASREALSLLPLGGGGAAGHPSSVEKSRCPSWPSLGAPRWRHPESRSRPGPGPGTSRTRRAASPATRAA